MNYVKWTCVDNMGYIQYCNCKEISYMPTISYFYGIIIVMYLRKKEHNPPHVHAITQDFDAPFLFRQGRLWRVTSQTKPEQW